MPGAPSYINRSPIIDHRQNKVMVRRNGFSAHNPVLSRPNKTLDLSSGSEGFSRLSLLQHLTFLGVGAGTMEALYQTRVAPHVQENMAPKDSLSKVAHEYGIPMGIGGGAGLALSLLISLGVRLVRGPQAKPEVQFSLPPQEPGPAAAPIPASRYPSFPTIVAQMPSEPMSETWEKDLPGYRKIKVLGTGGQGEAILAEKIGEPVVIKILLPSTLGDTTAQQRFMQEALTLKDLHHPNVVDFVEFKITRDAYYLLMEFVDGQNLKEQLNDGKQYTDNEALSIIYRAAEGLKYVWETAGIVHRDIKLHNIMTMAGEPFVKVIDFGLAKGQLSGDLTQTGLLACSPRYVAPERLKAMSDNSVVIDHRADIYSLGMVLYYMLAGRETFNMHEHALQPIQDIREINPQVPEKVWNLIQRMTAKDPSQRHLDYQQLLDEIAFCLQ